MSEKNDFRSLLSSFQDATNGAKSDKTKCRETSNTKQYSLKQRTERLWRIAQIRRAASVNRSMEKSQTLGSKDVRIAVCACVVDSFPQEKIWKSWMETEISITSCGGGDKTQESGKVSSELYIHAKFPEKIRSDFIRSKVISKTYRPNWNDVRVVRAMLALAKEALSDKYTTHVLFATESCIPIATLPEIAEKLRMYNNGKCSFVDAYNSHDTRCTRFDEHHIWNILAPNIPRDAIHKALPGWCLLCRSHLQSILDLPRELKDGKELWPIFDKVWAPEEAYFPTALALAGVLPGDEVINKSLMYAEWDDKAKIHSDRAHPRFFDNHFGKNFVQSLRRDGYLFMRKLKYSLDECLWKEAVINESKGKNLVGNKRSIQDTNCSTGNEVNSGNNRSASYEESKRHKII